MAVETTAIVGLAQTHPNMHLQLSIFLLKIYNFLLGQWIVPSVSGQCCPPTSGFIIEKINHNKGIMYGGVMTDGGIKIATNGIYLFQLSHNTIVS